MMALQKVYFVLFVGGYGAAQTCQAIWHGLSMDMSVAAYLTALPALAALTAIWLPGRWLRVFLKWYILAISIAMSLACVANAALYPHWGFPLDYTPIFYLTTSPAAAVASISFGQWTVGVLGIIFLTLIYYFTLCWLVKCFVRDNGESRAIVQTSVLAAFCVVLFILMRGGVTVSTMNLSRAYFSSEARLNHAAINPIFSFLYSAAHQSDNISPFDQVDDSRAIEIFEGLRSAGQSTVVLDKLPDIHIIIAEGFSDMLMPSLGGDTIAMQLDRIGQEGWLWTDAYASSFRTDRALTAILCAYPGMPTSSVLKHVEKLDGLPSLPRELKKAGYETSYYYGGDLNFTNVNALLQSAGFDVIVGDRDFPVSQKLSKWGAPDHIVAQRAIADLPASSTRKPRLTVLQTSSSHEPFDVPGFYRHPDVRVNAFMYTDSVIGDYYDQLKSRTDFDNTLVLIVADHYGAYPPEVSDARARHRIPLIMAGGAIEGKEPGAELDRPASQTDIAATLLALLGIETGTFRFSNNLLDPDRTPYAVFSEPTWAAIVTDQGFALNNIGNASSRQDSLAVILNAYMQTLYNDFSHR